MKSCKGVQYGLTIDRKNSGAIYGKSSLNCDSLEVNIYRFKHRQKPLVLRRLWRRTQVHVGYK